jgi:hypothetical protein
LSVFETTLFFINRLNSKSKKRQRRVNICRKMQLKQTKVQRTETQVILQCAAPSFNFLIYILQIFGCAAPGFPEIIPFYVWFKNHGEISRKVNIGKLTLLPTCYR